MMQEAKAATTAAVESVSRDDRHAFSKPTVANIRLITGFGVEGDAHAGEIGRAHV